jgi:vacuolar-type H+-ATPase subunit H
VVLKEIVKKIMETENEVRGRVEDAHSQAQKIVRAAESGSRDIIEKKRLEAVKEGQALIERLTGEAEEQRTLQVEKVRGGSAELLKSRSKKVDRAVGRIIDMVTDSGRI